MKPIIFFLFFILSTLTLHAQSSDEQILIFRHTGEINLLFASEVDSMRLSEIDSDGKIHNERVSHIFYTKDTTIIIPIAEIDSITFGNQNETVLHNDVRQLTDARDMPYILRTVGNFLYYKSDTPAAILPHVGEKLYYGESSDMMPNGLAAKVVSIETAGNEIKVSLIGTDLEEIFEKLFYAGRIRSKLNSNAKSQDSRRNAPDTPIGHTINIPIEGNMTLARIGNIGVAGNMEIETEVVIDLSRHYYYAHVTGNTHLGFEYRLESDDSGTARFQSPQIRIPAPTIAGVIHPAFYVSLFADLAAELTFSYRMQRNFRFEYEWTRMDGKTAVKNIRPRSYDASNHDEALVDLTLNGDIFAGVELGAELNLTGDRAGSRLRLKGGPYLNGELGASMLTDLRNYNPELYHKAHIDYGLRLGIDISTFDHEIFWIFGDEVEHPIFSATFNLSHQTFELFPNYNNTRAIRQTSTEITEVSAATIVTDNITHDLEMGFELIDEEENIIDSLYLEKPVMASCEYAQGFDTKFEQPDSISNDQELKVRPVFHYAGHTISAEPTAVKGNPNLLPIISYGVFGGTSYIAGASVVGTYSTDTLTYHIGNYLPVPYHDPAFVKTIEFITNEK